MVQAAVINGVLFDITSFSDLGLFQPPANYFNIALQNVSVGIAYNFSPKMIYPAMAV
jgi:hypothetical protein